ncbi:MAG: type II secretion system protein GspL, partial [Pseudomonadales bacterium]|nr:type II secretion system protein GspL [Pseudomonadales bacterium]
MSDFLCLRFKHSDIQELSSVAWSVLSADGRIQASGHGSLNDIAAQIPVSKAPRRNILIVPSSSVLLTSAKVPLKQHRHLKQVLGFVVEEQIIDPIESMHLATPAYHADETVHIAAVNRDLLASWLGALELQNILPDYLFVDVLCVPQKAGDWQLMFEDDKVLFRDADYSGMVLDKNTAKSVLQLAISNNLSAGNTPDNSLNSDTQLFTGEDDSDLLVTPTTKALNSIALLIAEKDSLSANANANANANAGDVDSYTEDDDSYDG